VKSQREPPPGPRALVEVTGRHHHSAAEQRAHVLGLGRGGLRAEVEEPALSSIDSPPHRLSATKADGQDGSVGAILYRATSSGASLSQV
jgi:hypothetical protein